MTDLDRLKRALRAVVRFFARRLDLTALYPATVVAQHGDGSVDVRASDPAKPSLSNVPIQYGVPGFSLILQTGGQVMVGFLGADRKLPYVLVYDQAAVTSLSILGGTKPVARIGDAVRGALPPALFTGTISGTGAVTGVPVSMANPFLGVITSGQSGAMA